jgi:geranylgeranyl pyrophosphate synthase
MLGNPNLTEKDLLDCQEIVKDTGALDYARHMALDLAAKATHILDQAPPVWNVEAVSFLRYVARDLVERKA